MWCLLAEATGPGATKRSHVIQVDPNGSFVTKSLYTLRGSTPASTRQALQDSKTSETDTSDVSEFLPVSVVFSCFFSYPLKILGRCMLPTPINAFVLPLLLWPVLVVLVGFISSISSEDPACCLNALSCFCRAFHIGVDCSFVAVVAATSLFFAATLLTCMVAIHAVHDDVWDTDSIAEIYA